MRIDGLIICLLILLIFTFVKYFSKHKFRETDEKLTYNDMENLFFEKFNLGIKPYKLLDIYTPMDLMLIESLLLSEEIPYHCDFKHFMGVRPFLPIINYNNVNLYIFEEDYNDAIIIINEYINRKNIKTYNLKDRARNCLELLIGGWMAYDPNKYLGITVYIKESNNIIKKT